MTPDQKKRLLKLLDRMADENDGEALNACRLANGYLKTLGTSWASLLDGAAIVEYEEDPDITETRNLLAQADNAPLRPGDRTFITSLQDGFAEYGSLTDKQLAALRKVCGRYA